MFYFLKKYDHVYLHEWTNVLIKYFINKTFDKSLTAEKAILFGIMPRYKKCAYNILKYVQNTDWYSVAYPTFQRAAHFLKGVGWGSTVLEEFCIFTMNFKPLNVNVIFGA